MWVWDRSIGLWLWGVFQPNQEIKCLFAQLDRPTTNQSNVVCDYSSGGSLSCFCVYWIKKCRMSPDVSGTRTPPRSQVRAPCVPRAGARSSAAGWDECGAARRWRVISCAITNLIGLVGFQASIIFPQRSEARPNFPNKQCCGRG